MTKAENRAAAKAYREEKQRRWREEAHAAAVAADLERLGALRKYLIFTGRSPFPAES
jgi:post-segregation antitoxin (ccd killing protein)